MTPPSSLLNISTHALREEGDVVSVLVRLPVFRFLPTPSARRATFAVLPCMRAGLISTHALREEGDITQRNTNPL